MNTDILIPIGAGSRHQDIELRYCLRSVEKHLSGVGNVWIIGERPEWLQNIVHVPCQDSPQGWNRARNIYRKIMCGINEVQDLKVGWDGEDFTKNQFTVSAVVLSDNFLFMNDDHYLLHGYDLNNGFPFYHRGAIDLSYHYKNPPQYTQYLNTLGALPDTSMDYDYDIHCPVLYSKGLFAGAFKDIKWPPYGYAIKSYYCNMVGVRGTGPVEDLKFKEPAMKESIYHALEGRSWFSIGDKCLRAPGQMLEVLQELYPKKSKYEY